ncbi:hypothetical protein X797_005112 [Metarhizium robertsii]|uniref:Uncharacterized protein n=1 Tax=Metarhizium robertsii TaxID=568076 RepID=A0A0A1UW66_9HYPO|nr:hypothetical protein X797_005112 [Metarhizium robertsii]
MQLVSHLMVLLAMSTTTLCEPATSIMSEGVSYLAGGGGCYKKNQYLGHFVKDIVISGKCLDLAHTEYVVSRRCFTDAQSRQMMADEDSAINFGTVDGWCWGYKYVNPGF